MKFKKVSVHNLKAIDVEIKPHQLVVLTGVSGSGKSSFGFDTVYVEGQRRYVESLSPFARRQMGELAKPEMESASGVAPSISIEQKTAGKNPRSTVGTMTQIHDFMRVLFARVATAYCPVSGEPLKPQSREEILTSLLEKLDGRRVIILAPYIKDKKTEMKDEIQELLRKGFTKVRLDGAWKNLEEEIKLDSASSHSLDIVVDRLTIQAKSKTRLAEAVTLALELGDGVMSVVDPDTREEILASTFAFSQKSGLSYPPLQPYDFSFNTPAGMCERCHGLGTTVEFDLKQIIDPNLSIAEDCCSIATSYQTVRYRNIYDNLFAVDTPWKKLPKEQQDLFLYGTKEDRWIKIHFVHPTKGYTWVDRIRWRGVLHEALKRYQEAKSDSYKKKMAVLMEENVCPECKGARIKPYPAAAKLKEKTITEILSQTVEEGIRFFEKVPLSKEQTKIAEELLKEIRERLHFLHEVGLDYLTLDRTSPTLSGGEAQRVRLASQIGCGLVGITYVLDEPSIGLHPRDNHKLIETLKALRDVGNSVLVVEHDEETIIAADHILDFGPGAGALGGELIVDGTLNDLLNSKESITGQYLTGKRVIEIPTKRRKLTKSKSLQVVKARQNNLKNITVEFPLKGFLCIAGVSGSGKSSLISDILYPALSNALHGGDHRVGTHEKIVGIEHIDKVIGIDQSPIGRNPRSNPATYIKLFDEIRDLFTLLPESKARGYKAGRFSFNVAEGSCPHCLGMGMVKIDMDFMEDAYEPCLQCQGKRFDRETLSIKYKEKSIFDILEMDVQEAYAFFEAIPTIKHKLELLMQVGLHYIKLGQFSTTLSGGEAQRIKLAKELARPETGRTLYILDEPTTGLHFHDIHHLLKVLHHLVDRGNTVLVIEHNMDVVKTADWVIELGPEGGEAGGRLLATGTPEEIAKLHTPTGDALRAALQKKPLKPGKTTKAQKVREGVSYITVKGASQNNLKRIDAEIPRGKITVCTGPSGSGKSSFAYETIYAEGQRRYTESLSPYARQFVEQMPKPIVDQVQGLSPAIAIEQKTHAGNPRSTVGTLTEIYDYLRILFSHIGIPHCPETGEVIQAISPELVVDRLLTLPKGEKVMILAPLKVEKSFNQLKEKLRRLGFLRLRLDGTLYTLDDEIPYNAKGKQQLHLVVDRLKIGESSRGRLHEAVEEASKMGENTLIASYQEKDHLFNLRFAVVSTGKSYPPITSHTFAFNTPQGMCPECEGWGVQYGFNIEKNPDIASLTLKEWLPEIPETLLKNLPKGVLKKLTPPEQEILLNGSSKEIVWNSMRLKWRGVSPTFKESFRSIDPEIREGMTTLLEEIVCPSCQGARLQPLPRHVTIGTTTIQEVCQKPLGEALKWIQSLTLTLQDKKILGEVMEQLKKRLKFLSQVGLDYLSLHRGSRTLSGGEMQRIRLARQLGSGLTEALYVLDEPTIGLHPKDNEQLNEALLHLKEMGNTLLLVEHDPMTIATADYLLDFGPKAGLQGGEVTAHGTLSEIKKNPNSLTGGYLSGRLKVQTIAETRDISKKPLLIKNASLHNLKNIQVAFPLHALTCVTGVSGSGKSTLIHDIVVPAFLHGGSPHATVVGLELFDHLTYIDQNPIGGTNRAVVATYAELLDPMRQFFAELPAAKMRGLSPKHFSPNHRKGMCSACFGFGYKRIELQFLPAVKIPCPECQGARLNRLSLEVKYKEKNLGEYLEATVQEVYDTFIDHPRIRRRLQSMLDVGLGYLKLGQEMATLSGGEAQRIKLSRELSRRGSGHTLFLLDEPTTGLHFVDVALLIQVLQRLVERGNTVIVIEHNMDLIRGADYIVDLGPGAGALGGEVIATGSPEAIRKNKKSITGRYL